MSREVVLAGQNVALAAMTAEDQPHFQKWLSENAELRAQIDDNRVPTMEDQKQWFARIQQPDRKFFSIVTLPDYELIGNGGFADIHQDKKIAMFRITIGSTDHHGKGLGTEATQLILRYGFETMGLTEISLVVLAANARAIRSYEKAGFRPVEATAEDRQRGRLRMTITPASLA